MPTETSRPSSYEAHLHARRERSLLAQSLIRRFSQHAAQTLQALARSSSRLTLRLVNEWYRRRAIRALHRLDDRMLSDIGLSRGEIEWVVRCGPPWQALHNQPALTNAGASLRRQAA